MPDNKLSIRIAGKTMIPALQAISAKGYMLSVWYTQGEDEGLVPQFDAEKDSRAFSATSPEGLLGLIAIWEVRGDDWRLKQGECELWDRLVEAAPVCDSAGDVIAP